MLIVGVEDTQSWKPITDFLSVDQTSYMRVESIAIDPQAPNKLYMYCGTSYWNSGKSAILYSDDYGDTFVEKAIATSQFPAHGNDNGRQCGERLAVDPNKGDILLCGSRTKGLWKSANGGATWTRKEIRDIWNAVVVFGAGNSVGYTGSLSEKLYPASYSSVLSVTSVGHTNDIGYSVPGYGPVLWKDCHIMDMSTNYAIRTTAPVQIPSGSNVLFKTRKEVDLNAGFEVAAGATFEVNVNPNNTINCN